MRETGKSGIQIPRKTIARNARRVWNRDLLILIQFLFREGFFWGVADVVQTRSRTEKMFPSHLSVNDLGVFAVVMVFGLIVVLLFMFDFVSTTSLIIIFCVLRDSIIYNACM